MKTTVQLAILSIALGLICSGAWEATASEIYDVQADWSNTSNPNGTWGYREADNFLPAVESWQRTLGGWTTAQPGWAESEDGNNRLPFWFQSNGTETFGHDWLAGDIVVHSRDDGNGVGNGIANLTWTSPIDAPVDITGSVWLGRDIGRAVDWSLWVNNIQLTGGSLFSGDAFDRANPFDLATGSGGAAVLQHLNLIAGDVVRVEFETISGAGEFVGVNLTIVQAPENVVPDSLTITRGNYVSGDETSLAYSDNVDLALQRLVTDIQSRTEFVVLGTSPTATPSRMEVNLEGAVFARSTVVQTVELWDYVAGAWELVDTRNASNMVDLKVRLILGGDLSRFVDPTTLSIEARIHFQSLSPRQRFASNTDQFYWTIE
jgi:hypothetical protein